jgi:tetratricopeptide (TPR) repeat protein
MTGKNFDPVLFWQELKQRKVVRVSTVYLAGTFALLEAADIIFPNIGFPSWCMTLLMIVLATGLIIVIALSWIFDITPEGIKRTKDIENSLVKEPSGVNYSFREKRSYRSSSKQEGISYNYEVSAEDLLTAKKKNRVYNYSSIVVILAVIILFTFSSANTVPFAKRDWIVITDLDNMTGNKLFDKSLYSAFSLTISQSRYINVLPRSRMLETLKRMEVNNDVVDDKAGREIAIREGISLYIVPSVGMIGNKYAIGARIMESQSGNLIRSEVVHAGSENEILDKLDLLSKKIRRSFGESRYNIAVQDKPLTRVTTSSLEALKLYSQGIDRQIQLDPVGARMFYEDALKLDTGFTAAKASLGNLIYERFDRVKGQELLKEAIKTVDKLTEKERLGILAFYAVNVENNLPKGIEYTKMRINLYPDDAAARNNLGWYYMNIGRYEDALTEYKATVRLFPDIAMAYNGICWIYIEKLGKIDSAKLWSEKMISDNPENLWGYFYLGSAWFSQDSLEKAQQCYEKARSLNPSMKLNLYRLAHTYRARGMNKNAIMLLEEVLNIDSTEYAAFSDMAVNYRDMGETSNANKYFSRFKKIATEIWAKEYPELVETYTTISAAEANLNEMDSSSQMLRKAMAIDSTKNIDFAGVLCLQGNIPEALYRIEKGLNSGYRDITWLKMNPEFKVLQNDSRFLELLGKYF